MQVIIKGNNKKIRLTKNNFLTSGGEGKIYAREQIVFKIYNNCSNIIPYSKIQELSTIKNSNVIKPKKLILNLQNKPIGYTMRYIKSTYPLCKIFTKAFRDQTGLNNKTVLKLVKRMQETIKSIHQVKILIVDLNELNFLVTTNFSDIYFIDVDSYQTPSFPATAIMDSIKDRHSSKFTKNTDWFSFGIVSFQMFIGIHPFKGKHPSLKTLDERMKANIPVFHKDVRYPHVCRPFDIIPQAYKDWYKAIFYHQKRLPPPKEAQYEIIIITDKYKVKSDSNFNIIKIQEFDEKIVKYLSLFGVRIIVTPKKIYKEKEKFNVKDLVHIALTPKNNKLMYAYLEQNEIKIVDPETDQILKNHIAAEEIMSYEGRLFIKNENIFSEINFIELSKLTQTAAHIISNILEKATQLYEGVVIQNLLGTYIISIFPEINTCYQITIPELEGYQIIDAKYDKNILIAIGTKKGKYDKFIIKLDNKFESYSIRKEEDISYCGINFTVLDNGIVIHINESEEMEIFSNKKEKTEIKVIDNSIIHGDMKLFKDGTQVLFSKNNNLYKINMKK